VPRHLPLSVYHRTLPQPWLPTMTSLAKPSRHCDCVRLQPRRTNPEKPANLRSWRVIIIRSRGEYLASVEAPDRDRAEVIAIRKYARDLSQGECGSKWADHMRSRAKLRGNRPVRNAHRVSVAYTESCSLACVSNLKTAGVAVGSRQLGFNPIDICAASICWSQNVDEVRLRATKLDE
jgi:hypothetical protein